MTKPSHRNILEPQRINQALRLPILHLLLRIIIVVVFLVIASVSIIVVVVITPKYTHNTFLLLLRFKSNDTRWSILFLSDQTHVCVCLKQVHSLVIHYVCVWTSHTHTQTKFPPKKNGEYWTDLENSGYRKQNNTKKKGDILRTGAEDVCVDVCCVMCAVCCVMCDVWCVICDVWCVICDVWCVMCDMWSLLFISL